MNPLKLQMFICIFSFAFPVFAQNRDEISPYCQYVEEDIPIQGAQKASSHLCELISKALQKNLNLQSHKLEAESIEGEILQSALTPNPTLDLEVDRQIKSDTNSESRNHEFQLLMTQPIELGDKRQNRKSVASAQKGLAQLNFSMQIKQFIHEFKTLYFETLSSHKVFTLAESRKKMASETMQTVNRKASIGGGSTMEPMKAQLAFSIAEVTLEQKRQILTSNIRKLKTMAAIDPDFELNFTGKIENITEPPSIEKIDPKFVQAPMLKITQLESELIASNLELERSNSVSDISVSGGVKYNQENRNIGAIVGISLPLGVFNKNQGKILENEKKLSASNINETARKKQLQMELVDELKNMQNAFNLSSRLKNDIIKNAESTLAITTKAYQMGKLSYLDVMDSQRTLFDVQEQYILTLTEYHISRSKIELILGQAI